MAFVLAVPVALAASRFSGVFPYSRARLFLTRRGGGGGCSVRIAIFSVAARAGMARASGLKALQRPCGARLQTFQSLVRPPPLPQPLSTPAGGIRGAQQPYSANAVCGVAFTGNGQHSNLPGTTGAWGHTDIACRHFEGWRFMVNSSTSNTQPHTVVGSPFSPGGVRGGGAVQELLHRRY